MTTRILRNRTYDADFRYQLGDRLRRLRNEHGLTLLEVRDRTEIGIELLSRAERGLSQFTVMELMKLALVYQTPLYDIVGPLWPLVEVSE